jgi:probable HAF family extracellular repeat protein
MTALLARHRLLAACAIVVAAAGLPNLAAAQALAVKVVDMGELSPGLGSEANAINNANRTVGRAMSNVDFQYRQVIWDVLNLQVFDACCTGFLPTLRSINLGGEVVGDYYATRDDSIPVYWNAQGTAFNLPALGPYSFGFANSINDSGQIAGASYDANMDVHAVVWDRTTQVNDLGFLGEPAPGFKRYAVAKGINNLGHVVGQGLVGMDQHAFVWRNGSYTDLGLGAATHINDAGLIAGYAPGLVPVIWKNGKRTNLRALGGGRTAYGHLVNGINSKGDLVGYAPAPNPGVFTIAVLWRGGRAISLGHYPGGNNSYATGINDSGQIVGSGNLVPGGPMHALRWTVTPRVVAVELQ